MAMFTIQGARVNAGLSQTQVADKLGMSVNSWLGYEKGRKVLRADKIFDFSELVNVSTDEIIFFAPDYTKRVYNQKKLRKGL